MRPFVEFGARCTQHADTGYCGYIFSGVQQRGLADTWLAD
jgi:hypothetical protein